MNYSKRNVVSTCLFLLAVILLTVTQTINAQDTVTCVDVTNENGNISAEECSTLQELNAEEDWFTTAEACSWTNLKCDENQNLTTLTIRDANLTSIPDSIDNLQNLTEINIIMDVVDLPETILNLQNLSILHLDGTNNVTTFLDKIDQLENLTILGLFDNENLTNIPDTVGNISTLEVLSIAYNDQLTSIPTIVGNLENLTHLLIVDNDGLTEIPDEIGNLTTLDILSIMDNDQLTSIPNTIGNLQNLTRILINGNNDLTKIPAEIGNISTLDSITILFNDQLINIPDTIGNLQNLTDINIRDNHPLIIIPEALSENNFPLIESYRVSPTAGAASLNLLSPNCDSQWTLVDAVMLKQLDALIMSASDECMTDSSQVTVFSSSCDINDDMTCGLIDAVIIQQCDSNLDNPFCSIINQ